MNYTATTRYEIYKVVIENELLSKTEQLIIELDTMPSVDYLQDMLDILIEQHSSDFIKLKVKPYIDVKPNF